MRLGLIALLGALLAWTGADIFVLRHVKALLKATGELGAGNLSVRTNLPKKKGELGELAQAFDRMAESLEKANQDKADFTAMVVHDLRSPLTAVIGAAAILEEGLVGPVSDEQKKWLAKLQVNGRNLLKLTNDLLDLSKLEAGSLDLVKGETDVGPLIRQALDNYLPLAKEKKISLKGCVEGTLPRITADARRLEEVVDNLLSNAIKFTAEGGKVEMGARLVSDSEITIWVKDNGAGISAAEIGALFEKYRQTSSGKSSLQKGTGLGLVICKMIVEAHGGRIWVESEEKRGTTFFFTLPTGAPKENARPLNPPID